MSTFIYRDGTDSLILLIVCLSRAASGTESDRVSLVRHSAQMLLDALVQEFMHTTSAEQPQSMAKGNRYDKQHDTDPLFYYVYIYISKWMLWGGVYVHLYIINICRMSNISLLML